MSTKWIDVSAHQGIVDWPKVRASGVVGAVLRAGYGNDASQQDAQFAANIRNAPAAGLKVGVYWFSYADSAADALKEWAVCRSVIQPYRTKILFVAYDYEYASADYYQKIHGAAPANGLVNEIVGSFLGAAKADGWSGLLYANNDYRLNVFSPATLGRWSLWLADYSGGPDAACVLQQTTDSGSVPGIAGKVDLDAAFQTFDEPVASPPYTCDTSGTVVVARGSAYQIGIVCDSAPKVAAGTADILTVLPRNSSGNKWYYYLVPIGKSGDQVGVYINGGPRQLIIRIG